MGYSQQLKTITAQTSAGQCAHPKKGNGREEPEAILSPSKSRKKRSSTRYRLAAGPIQRNMGKGDRLRRPYYIVRSVWGEKGQAGERSKRPFGGEKEWEGEARTLISGAEDTERK